MKGHHDIRLRLFANVIDYFFMLACFVLDLLFFGHSTGERSVKVEGLAALLPLFFWCIYFPVMESLTGCTLGHWAFHLKVINSDGDTPSIVEAFKRRITDWLELTFLGIPAFILISKTKRHQRLGDIWAGTFVIQNKRASH
jgi:uncharacterized RDD family membrane protein YckC